jgi:hypothetical protein
MPFLNILCCLDNGRQVSKVIFAKQSQAKTKFVIKIINSDGLFRNFFDLYLMLPRLRLDREIVDPT